MGVPLIFQTWGGGEPQTSPRKPPLEIPPWRIYTMYLVLKNIHHVPGLEVELEDEENDEG